MDAVKILVGQSHPKLAVCICEELGLPAVGMQLGTFADGEIRVEINENVRGMDCFVIQSVCRTCTSRSVNDMLQELLIMISALKGASAHRVTAVIPYYGYARQDKKDRSRACITAKLVARQLETAGVDRVITMDLHSSQIQGFFNVPVDNLYGERLIFSHFSQHRELLDNVIFVSPDAGGAKRAERFASYFQAPFACISKIRSEPGVIASMTLNGDVRGKRAIIVDDMADTCGTLCAAARLLLDKGVVSVRAAVTHAVLSGQAVARLRESAVFDEVIVCDTLPQHPHTTHVLRDKLTVLSSAKLFSDAIERTHKDMSISCLFTY